MAKLWSMYRSYNVCWTADKMGVDAVVVSTFPKYVFGICFNS